LSSALPAITREGVRTGLASFYYRFVASLCVALMAFYAATAPVKAADQIQHMPALIALHAHDNIGSFPIYSDHGSDGTFLDHHGQEPVGDSQPDDPLGAGHHHHGDTGPNLIVPNVMAALSLTPSADLHVIGTDRQIAGLRSIGPERPPRLFSLNV